MSVFVGLQPPIEIRDEVQAMWDRLSSAPTALRESADDLHVTLCYLGEVRDITDLTAALRTACEQVRPATIELGPATVMLMPTTLAIPAVGADDLARTVRAVGRGWEEKPQHLPFFGHMSVARFRSPADGAHLLIQQWEGLAFCGSWTATEICVFSRRSHSSATRYHVLDRIRLV
ncbi:2'-5' RNA ligase family protein [Nonomuraea sp. M3C6]|uniref:2'-5' RNA ligase family protein n=1 Tax=Nonomuraea marmarensis TaxID=3351344 RepID=A0ABW7AU66_9ACTN